MKKTIAILIAALMLLSIVPVNVFAADANACKVPAGAEHTKANCAAYTLVETIAPEACKFGYTLYSCDACGTVFADDFVRNEDGHVWETEKAATAATCTDPARKEKKVCSVCKEVHPELNGDVVAGSTAIGGKHKIVWGEVADCTVEERIGTCSKCGITEKMIADTHNYGTTQYPDSYVDPTCTEKGSASFKCKDCAHVKTLEIDALGHAPQDIPAKDFENCEKPGNTAGQICTRCNEYIKAPEMVGHSGKCDWKFVSFVAGKEPTCTTDGEAIYKCTANGNVEHFKTDVAVARHTYELEPEVIEATCTTWGFKLYYCIECGDLKPFEDGDKIAPLGHDTFEEATVKSTTGADTCEEGGILVRKWTCHCGVELGDTVDNYKAHAIKTAVVAPFCHQVGFTVDYCTNPDCIIVAKGTYKVSDTLTLDLSFAVEGLTALQLVPGKDADGKDHNGVYAVGTTKDATRHALVTEIINDSTCTVKGAKFDFCPYCSYRGEVVEIALKPHQYPATPDQIVSSPICGVNDQAIYFCDTCGIDANKKVVEIPNSADHAEHKFSIKVPAKAPECKESGETGYTAHEVCEYCSTKSDAYKFLDHVAHNFVTEVTIPQCDGTKGVTWEQCEWCYTHNDKFTPVVEDYVYVATKTYETWDDAKEVHAGLSATRLERGREGNCYVTALDLYACADCGKNVLVVVDDGVSGSHQYILDKTNANYDTYHNDAVAPTCQNFGYTELFICTVCGFENGGAKIEKVAHKMLDYKCGEGQYCEYEWDGCTEVTGNGYADHVYLTLYTAVADCLKIGYAHKYCAQCLEESEEYLTAFVAPNGHSLKDKAEKAPTCVTGGNTAGKYCEDCDYKTWTDVAATGAHKNAAGETFYDKCTDKVEDRKCTVCKVEYTDSANKHTMVPGATVDVDCNNEGYTLEGCVDCGFEQMTDFKPKTEHTFVEIDRVPATILNTGLITYQCSVCKAEGIETYTTEVIPVLAEVGIILNANNVATAAGKTYTDSSLVALTITLDAAKTQAWGVAFDLYYPENVEFVKAEFSANNKFVANTAAVDNNYDPAKGNNPGDYVSISAFAPNAEDKTLANETIEGKMEFVTLYFRVNNGDITTGTTATAKFEVKNSEIIDIKGADKEVEDGTEIITINKFMDYNEDGDVTLQDILAASKILSKELTLKDDKGEDVKDKDGNVIYVTYDVALDVDKDGEITAADLLAILDYINGAKSYAEVAALN